VSSFLILVTSPASYTSVSRNLIIPSVLIRILTRLLVLKPPNLTILAGLYPMKTDTIALQVAVRLILTRPHLMQLAEVAQIVGLVMSLKTVEMRALRLQGHGTVQVHLCIAENMLAGDGIALYSITMAVDSGILTVTETETETLFLSSRKVIATGFHLLKTMRLQRHPDFISLGEANTVRNNPKTIRMNRTLPMIPTQRGKNQTRLTVR